MPETILRIADVRSRTGLGRSSIYAAIKAGEFPKPVSLSGRRSVGWIASEIEAWIQARIKASRKSGA